ncbi:MAG: hypothetical protein ACRDTR_18695 [Rubrobacter sp.]
MESPSTTQVERENGTGRDRAGQRDERRTKMIDRELAHREFEVVEDWFASLADGERELSLLLVAQEKARAALARAQDDAAMEARDVLSQADEALVMG